MKKKNLLSISAAALLCLTVPLLLSNCTDESITEEPVSLSRAAASNYVELYTPSVTGRSVTFTAKACSFGSTEDNTVKKAGFAYSSKNQMPAPGSGSVYRSAKLDADSVFTLTVNNISEDLVYYVRAYVITAGSDTIYSEVATYEAEVIAPQVELMPVSNRSRMGAVVFGKITTAGTKKLSKWGFCMGHDPLPSLEANEQMEYCRDTCKYTGFEGEFGSFFMELKAKTLYHVRAFVTTSDGGVYYSQDRLFRTSEGGQCSWKWASNEQGAKDAGAWDRISEAMDSAMYYYNNYSNLYITASVEYNSGVTTADCSLGGWIRFGANSRYQWVGTAQHELNHGLGGGTAGNWSTMLSSGVWTGKMTQRTARAVMKDQTQEIHGDSQHYWPCGINQREEVTNGTNSYGEAINNERMLRANAMVFNAMRIDGLWNHY